MSSALQILPMQPEHQAAAVELIRAAARRFYARHGYRQCGAIENYLPDSGAMQVFCKLLP